jgi:hypothetical protein
VFSEFIGFINLLAATLLVGGMFAAWLLLNPQGMDAGSYLIVQQQGIRTLNPALPGLGALSILTTIVSALLARENKVRLSCFVAAACCFIAAGLITRFRNQPINAVVIQWTLESLPAKWMCFRDQWWMWHCVRLLSGFAGLVLVIFANLRCF